MESAGLVVGVWPEQQEDEAGEKKHCIRVTSSQNHVTLRDVWNVRNFS